MTEERCVVLGGGGHARVVIDCLRSQGSPVLVGVLDAALAPSASGVDDLPVLGDDSLLPALRQQGVSHFVVGVGGVGDNTVRERLFQLGVAAGLEPAIAVHRRATVAPSAQIGAGTVVLAGAVVNPGVVIGCNVIVNTGAVVDHDCSVGDHAHVSPRATLCGRVSVAARAHVGAGAVVLQGVSIGAAAVIGLGAVVLRDVDAGQTVVGVPAR